MELDEVGDDPDAEVIVLRSLIDENAWVAVPLGLNVDQSFAQHCGRLHLVKAWASTEYAPGATSVRWQRVNRDQYRMVVR